MGMKNTVFVLAMTFLLAAAGPGCTKKQAEPWTSSQLMPPERLASIIEDPGDIDPLIICIGPGALIKGSVDVGQTRDKESMEKLRTLLSGEAKDRDIVIYCGCCPFKDCPNIRPAFSLLNEMKFTRHKLLNLENNLKTNWIEPGYPVNASSSF